MAITFFVFFALLVLNYKILLSSFKTVKPKTWAALLLILFIAFSVRLCVSCPSTDSKLYESVSIAGAMGSAENYDYLMHPRPKGYAFLIHLSFLLFGESLLTISWINLLFSLLTVLIVFLLTHLIIKNDFYALTASLIMALMPLHVLHVFFLVPRLTALFFVSLAYLFFIIAAETKKKETILLAVSAMVLALHIRVENLFYIFFLFPCFFLFFKKNELKKLVLPLIFFLLLILPLVPNYFSARGFFYEPCALQEPTAMQLIFRELFPEIENPSTFSLEVIPKNIEANAGVLLNPEFYPVILFVFAFISVNAIFSNKKTIPIIGWFFVFWLVYGPYFGSSFINVELYQLLLLVPLTIMIVIGMHQFENIAKKPLLKAKGKFTQLIPLIPIILFLLVLFAFVPTKIFFPACFGLFGPNCIYNEIFAGNELIESNACVFASDCELNDGTTEKTFLSLSLPSRQITQKLADCPDNPVYYFYFESFLLNSKKCLGNLPNECVKSPFFNSNSLIVYKLNCK